MQLTRTSVPIANSLWGKFASMSTLSMTESSIPGGIWCLGRKSPKPLTERGSKIIDSVHDPCCCAGRRWLAVVRLSALRVPFIPSKLCSQRLILQSTCYADRDDADQTTSFRTAEPRKHSTFSPKVHNNAPRAPSKGLQTQRCRSGGYRKVIYRSARLACTSCRPFSSLSQDALRSR
jgi:hypothetical protein